MIILIVLIVLAVTFIFKDKILNSYNEKKAQKEEERLRIEKEKEQQAIVENAKNVSIFTALKILLFPEFMEHGLDIGLMHKDPTFKRTRDVVMAILIIGKAIEQLACIEKDLQIFRKVKRTVARKR